MKSIEKDVNHINCAFLNFFLIFHLDIQFNFCFDILNRQITLFWNYLIYLGLPKASLGKLLIYCLFEVQSRNVQNNLKYNTISILRKFIKTP